MIYSRKHVILIAAIGFCLALRPANGFCQEEPATLDLVKQANYCMNALAGTTDSQGELMFKCSIVPPSINHDAFSVGACDPKYLESLAMMSLMTGESLQTPPRHKVIQYVLSSLGTDGMFYCKIGPSRPWDTSSPVDWANMYGQGRLLRAMLALYQLDGDPVWIQRMKRLVHTLERIAIRRVDPKTGKIYAYYPNNPGYGDVFSYPITGWKNTNEPGQVTEAERKEVGKTIADVPNASFGIPLYIGGVIEPLTRYWETFHDTNALRLAGELVRFMMKPTSAWMPDGHIPGVISAQNGWFSGQFHAHTIALRGILEYAIATDNPRLKLFARSGYEYCRTLGIPRLGWFEEYTGKDSYETCDLADMTALAIKLSEAGIGDYWDDVDCYVRNALTQCHFTDYQEMVRANERASHKPLGKSEIQTLKRVVGTFEGWGTPNQPDLTRIMNCCEANGSEALYYIWDSIVRNTTNGQVSVNLLLNRQSPWLDVESYLPYRGKVILRIKKDQRLAVRIPDWVDKSSVKLEINGTNCPAMWTENFIEVGRVRGGNAVKITFPMEESREHYAVDSYQFPGCTNYLGRFHYTITFRGDTAIQITPKSPGAYPVYAREYYESNSVPLVHVSDYVATKRIAW